MSKKIMAQKAATPGGANDLLKTIRALMKFAIDAELRTDDPTLRVKLYPEGEIHTWTDDEISQFEARWPIGTRERMAFALFLFTGQRKSDVVRMAWTDIVGKAIKVVQAKTGAKLTIALHPDLQEILGRWPRTHVAILTTAFGKPFSTAGFGNMMSDAIRGAGLPARCVSHGLRKAAARRLAEAGCSEKQIAAVTGHRTLKEVARYTRAADQERLAAQAVGKLTEQKTPRNSQPQPAGLGNPKKFVNPFNDGFRIVVPRGGIPGVKEINILQFRGSLNCPAEFLEFSSRVIHARLAQSMHKGRARTPLLALGCLSSGLTPSNPKIRTAVRCRCSTLGSTQRPV